MKLKQLSHNGPKIVYRHSEICKRDLWTLHNKTKWKMNKLIREEVDSPFIFVCVCACVEASAFLVCHRRSRVLSEPWPLPEDETLGKVSPHLR